MEANEELGPIDIVVIAYAPGSPMTGDAVPLLMDLVERGIIRVLDAMFVSKDEDGKYSGFEAKDLDDKGVGDYRLFEGASSGLLGQEDLEDAAAALEPGTVAAVLVWENRWAAPVASALRRSGGQLVASGRIPVQAILASLDASEAVH